MKSMWSNASINKAAGDADCHADDICNKVVYIGTAVKGGLDELNEAAEGTRPHKYREQSKAASSGEWK